MSLLTMAAPPAVLAEYQLNGPSTAAFEEQLDAYRIDANDRLLYAQVVAAALYWACKRPVRRRTWPLLSRLSIRPDVLFCVIELSALEEFAAMEKPVAQVTEKVITAAQRKLDEALKLQRSERGRKNVQKRHSAPGGAHDLCVNMRAIWATGKYTSRNQCALENYEKLGVAYITARDYLKNAPDPTGPA